MSRWVWTLGVLSVLAATAVVARTQSSGTAVNLSGTWQRDTYLSDHPEQVDMSIRIGVGQRSLLSFFPEPERGEARGRGGRSGGPPSGSSDQPSGEEQRRLDDITRGVRRPPSTLEILQAAPSVSFKDEVGQSYAFRADVKHEKQTFGSATVESTTHWEGPQLVIDFDLGKDRTMIYTYSIVPTTKQLLWQVSFQRGALDVSPFAIRHVYNRAQSR